jgi:hypothetical protein
MVLQQSVEVFLYLVFDMHKTTTKKLVPSSKRAELQRERTTPKSRRKRRKKMQKEEPLRRFVFQISRFLRHFFLLFSLFVRRVCVGRFLSLLEHTASPISHPIVFLARAVLFLGFKRERERKREGIKVVLRSSTLIIIIIIKYDQTRHQRRIQVAEIRSEEHQIGLVPEKLLPMHETGLSSQEASGKRTREVRKPAQSRETELVIAQSAEKQVTAAERYHRHTQQGGKEEE